MVKALPVMGLLYLYIINVVTCDWRSSAVIIVYHHSVMKIVKIKNYLSSLITYPLVRFTKVAIAIFRRVRKTCEKRLLASSCPSVRPHGTAWLSVDGFS